MNTGREATPRTTFGLIRDRDGTPVRAVVEVVDRDLRDEEILGRTKSDRRGRYMVDYTAHEFRRAEKDTADVLVRVLGAKGEVLVASETFFNAPNELEVNLRVPRRCGETELGRYLHTLQPLLQNVKLSELSAEDIEFLLHETGIPEDRLQQLASAAIHAAKTKVELAVFYGLTRQGLPWGLSALLSLENSRKRDALERSIADNIVAVAEVDRALDALTSLARRATADSGPIAIARSAGLDEAQRERFLRFALDHGDMPDFWSALSKHTDLDPDAVASLRFVDEISAVTLGEASLDRALVERRAAHQWDDSSDISRLDLADWTEIVAEHGEPEARASALYVGAQTVFAGPVIRNALIEGRVDVSDSARSLLQQHPELDLTAGPLPLSLRGEDGYPELAVISRLGRITAAPGRPEAIVALRENDYDSALAVARKGKERFVRQMANALGGDASAEAVHDRSERIATAVDVGALQIRDFVGPDILGFIPRLPLPGTPDEPGETPDWAALFGRRTSCACEHCASLLSPSAYFTDLMQQLSKTPLFGGGFADDAFLQKRSDLQYVLLDCRNAMTPVPYIDLVIEQLEDAVLERSPAMDPPPASTHADWTAFIHEFQTHVDDTARLRAMPEHEAQPASSTEPADPRWAAWELAREASVPWTLPFGPYERKAELLAEHLGVDLADVYELFGVDDVTVAATRLGLGLHRDLILGGGDRTAIWGADHASLGQRGGIEDLLARARLEMDELLALLDTSYLDGAVTLSRDEDEPCDLELATLDGLTAQLDRVQQFLRLRTRLSMTIVELDELLASLGLTMIDADALIALDRATRLGARLGVAPQLVGSLLDEHGRLADLLHLSAEELNELIELSGLDPAAPLQLVDLKSLIAAQELIASTGSTATELRYLLTGQDSSLQMAPTPSEIEAFVAIARGTADSGDPELELATALAPSLQVAPATAMALAAMPVPADPSQTIWEMLHAGADSAAAEVAELLMRAARIVSMLRLTSDQVRVVLDHAAALGTPVLEGLAAGSTYEQWRTLARICRLGGALPGRQTEPFALLQAALQPGATIGSQLAVLSERTGWEEAALQSLAGHLPVTIADLSRAGVYEKLAAAMALMRRFDIAPDTLAQWANPSATALDLAGTLEAAARARHLDEGAWWEVLTPLNDQLREDKRDALMTLLHRRRGLDVDGVYGALLLDSQMSSCALTSRIKQANAAIQLFVQRLRMNLEDAKLPAGAELDGWDWMRNYRVWEANRKVFLFPENWIEPELRHDKSVLFRELEEQLLQDEPTDQRIRDAFLQYVDGLSDIGRLDVCGIFDGPDHVHVVARTFGAPHDYYYRRRDLTTQIWTAWEPLDVGIRADHVFPVEVHGRVHVIWGEAQRTVDETEPDKEISSLSLKWVERRRDGWSTPRNLGGDIVRHVGYEWDSMDIRVRESDGFEIELYLPIASGRSIMGAAAGLGIDPCTGAAAPLERYRTEGVFASIPTGSDSLRLSLIDSDPTKPPYVLGINTQSPVFERQIDLDTILSEHSGLAAICALIVEALSHVQTEADGYESGRRERPLLTKNHAAHRIVPGVQEREFRGERTFALDIEERTFVAMPRGRALVRPKKMGVEMNFFFMSKYFNHRFETFYHPHVCAIREAATRSVDAIMRRDFTMAVPALDFEARYGPTLHVGAYPTLDLAFDADAAYASYNWEIFLHVPMLVAQRLASSGRYEEAQRWYHYVFDPTAATADGVEDCWRFPPFHDIAAAPPETLDDLLRDIADGEHGDQVEVMRRDPFNPHAIARLRPVAYMKDVVLAYLQNLVEWADSLFRRDTIETLNEATQLYMLASEILGDDVPLLPAQNNRTRSYRELEDGDVDGLSNVWLELEDRIGDAGESGGTRSTTPHWHPYFCVPQNDKLRQIRVTIADRLFKIRHCQNIAGRVRQLPLFEPPIDPALLVRARAAGLDLAEVLGATSGTTLSAYRFDILIRHANEANGELRSLGVGLLSALEKKDAEELTLLRTRHEGALLDLERSALEDRIAEAEATLAGLRATRRATERRRAFYESRTTNASERSHVDLLNQAHYWDLLAQSHNIAASVVHALPDVTVGLAGGATWGGSHIGHSLRAMGGSFAFVSGALSHAANLASIAGGREQRQLDWDFQAESAAAELESLDEQIVAAEIRVALADHARRTHERRIEHQRQIEEYLRQKFTSAELYGWMVARVSGLYHQMYTLAVDFARRAERAAQHELAADSLNIIGFEHFDSAKRGLLAAERLGVELRRLQARYLERNEREFDLTKHISLATIAPQELLRLRETGSCTFTLPEVLFDLDFPGHVRRRIKSASVSIPCVAGPYATVNATLRLDQSQIRSADPGHAMPAMAAFEGRSAIATSTGQNDAGVFEFSFRDDRLLPFEGAGAISQWTLEIPKTIPSFDHDTISDVVLHMRYTASDAPDRGADVVADLDAALQSWLDSATGREPMRRILSMRREFSAELHRFLNPPTGEAHDIVLEVTHRHFAAFLRRRALELNAEPDAVQARVWFKLVDDAPDIAGVSVELRRDGGTPNTASLTAGDVLPRAEFDTLSGVATGRWGLGLANGAIDPALIDDVLIDFAFRPAPT